MGRFVYRRLTADEPESVFTRLSELDRLCCGAEGWSAESFRSEAAKPEGVVIAACCGEEIAGLFAGFTAGDTGEVLTIGVAPEYRRLGAARGMLEQFFSLLPEETENIALEVRCSNSAAVALYEGLGFSIAGTRRRFYVSPTEDAYIMVKNVTKEK